jgi:UDPglucose 6-dehydrogenase
MKANVAIIGMGHVGRMMHNLLTPHANIVTYDVRNDEDYPTAKLAQCSVAVICVGTPSSPDGSCDTSSVREAVTRLPVQDILLKSTVAPGTTDMLVRDTGKNICFSPEYFGETTFYNPFWRDGPDSIPFLIFGGERSARQRFIDFLLPAMGPNKTYFQCSAVEAEIIKYMENAYIATKVSFVNEFRNICTAMGADWHTVREGWLLDSRVSPFHTAAFRDAPGFDGKCLPKDLRAIIAAVTEAGYSPELLLEILNSNERFRSQLAE